MEQASILGSQVHWDRMNITLSSFAPLLWRYFFWQYAKTLGLSLAGFLVILIATRLEDAAKLISTGAHLPSVVLYIIYQVPYVMQIALPIATLIASLYLFQKLSSNNELTALRASGISLFEIIIPLLLVSCLLAFFSFYVIIDCSVRAHLAAKKLEFTLREMNPLAVLQNSRLLQNQGISLDMKGSLISDKQASDLILAMKRNDEHSCTLILAKNIATSGLSLDGKYVSLITTKPSAKPDEFDDLLIENSKESSTPMQSLTLFTNKRSMWKASDDLLKFRLLLAKKKLLMQKKRERVLAQKSVSKIKKKLQHISIEIIKRLSISMAIISFTVLGTAFGCKVGRSDSKKRYLTMVLLASLFLVSFLAGKGVEDKGIISAILYLFPHFVIIGCSYTRLRKIQEGRE